MTGSHWLQFDTDWNQIPTPEWRLIMAFAEVVLLHPYFSACVIIPLLGLSESTMLRSCRGKKEAVNLFYALAMGGLTISTFCGSLFLWVLSDLVRKAEDGVLQLQPEVQVMSLTTLAVIGGSLYGMWSLGRRIVQTAGPK